MNFARMLLIVSIVTMTFAASCRSAEKAENGAPVLQPEFVNPLQHFEQPLRYFGADPDRMSHNDLVSSLRVVSQGDGRRFRIDEEVGFSSYGTNRIFKYTATTTESFEILDISAEYFAAGSRVDEASWRATRDGATLRIQGEQRIMRYDLEKHDEAQKLRAEIELDAPLALLPVRPYFLEMSRPAPLPRMITVMELQRIAEPPMRLKDEPEKAPERLKASAIVRPTRLALEGERTIEGVRYLRHRLEGGALWWEWSLYWVDARSSRCLRFRFGDSYFQISTLEALSLEKDLNPNASVETIWRKSEAWRVQFSFEESRFARRAAVRLTNGFNIGFADGDETVIVLGHCDSGDQGTIDDEFSYGLAIALPGNAAPGTYLIGKTCRTFLSYAHTGPHAPHYLARDGQGRVIVMKSESGVIEGRIELQVEPDMRAEFSPKHAEWEGVVVKLRATFKAVPR
ncbi:MAG: hypothetical protein HYY17_05630 [Planctomycetes bacterium]|nr:hypothetical protein [Planctomycetota bacterium]